MLVFWSIRSGWPSGGAARWGPASTTSTPPASRAPRRPPELLRTGLQAIPADRLWGNPDCGLKTLGWPETRSSLANLVAAARTVRGELPES
ncbi:cobalamin-independent methionine synthase catalytic subunit [Streptomyces sp. BK340]|nr:cobalamin-independent methionine synthase catalytic subunit [Streptomyces sp. BK340]